MHIIKGAVSTWLLAFLLGPIALAGVIWGFTHLIVGLTFVLDAVQHAVIG